jgi:hypothetical protein
MDWTDDEQLVVAAGFSSWAAWADDQQTNGPEQPLNPTAMLDAIDVILDKIEPLSRDGAYLAIRDSFNPFWRLDQLFNLLSRATKHPLAHYPPIRERRQRYDQVIHRLGVCATADEHGQLWYGILDLKEAA